MASLLEVKLKEELSFHYNIAVCNVLQPGIAFEQLCVHIYLHISLQEKHKQWVPEVDNLDQVFWFQTDSKKKQKLILLSHVILSNKGGLASR